MSNKPASSLPDEDDFTHYFKATQRLSEENAELRAQLAASQQEVERLCDERLQIQRALASSVLNDPTEDDDPPYSTTELVHGVLGLITMKESSLKHRAKLRQRVAELEEELTDAVYTVAGSQMGSIGSLNNVYLPQVGVEQVKRWRAALEVARDAQEGKEL